MAVKNNPLNPRQRLLIFAGILVLWLLVICGRLVYLQIFSYGDFVQRAARQERSRRQSAVAAASVPSSRGQPAGGAGRRSGEA